MYTRKLGTLTAVTIMFVQVAAAQTIQAGADVAYTNDVYEIVDNGGIVRSVPLPGPEFAVRVRYEFKRNTFAEAGFSTKPYWEGFIFSGAPYYSTTEAFWTVKLNAGIGHRFPITKKLAIVPAAGLSFGANTLTYIGSMAAWGRVTFNGSQIQYAYTEDTTVDRFFGLANTSLSIERTFFQRIILGARGGYHAGWKDINILHLQYTVDNRPYEATLRSKGSYWDVGVAVFYLFSKT